MSTSALPIHPAYLYRLAPADAAQVQQLVRQALGADGWTFGGAAIWDVVQDPDPQRLRKNLRPISQLSVEIPLDLRGDFGHAFNTRAEVRWKRIDATSYDVLVLAEQPLALEGVKPLKRDWRADPVDHLVAAQSDKHPPLRGKRYYGPQGAVVWVRYTRCEEARP